jgi:hypothetical protein
MKFSIILNSRARTTYLHEFINNIFATTANKSNIEILIRLDDDDFESVNFSKSIDYPNVRFFYGQKPHSLCGSFNELAFKSNYENIFVCNDDMRVLTPNWDLIAEKTINQYLKNRNISDNIYYCKTECNSMDTDRSKGYCSFPIISKEAVNTIGFFMYECFVAYGGDSSIYRVYDAIDRVIDLTDIYINHLGHRTRYELDNSDIIGVEMRNKSFQYLIDPYSLDISKEVEKLRKKINESRKP